MRTIRRFLVRGGRKGVVAYEYALLLGTAVLSGVAAGGALNERAGAAYTSIAAGIDLARMAAPVGGEAPDEEGGACYGGTSPPRPAVSNPDGSVTVHLGGDQLGRYGGLNGQGNNRLRTVRLTGLVAMGAADEVFRLRFRQIHGADRVRNGQFARLTGPDGRVIASNINLMPDRQQGLAAGDEHLMIVTEDILVDLGGIAGPVRLYRHADAAGDPELGDNDGALDFGDTGCGSAGTA